MPTVTVQQVSELSRILGNALLFAAKPKSNIPPLEGVRFDRTNGELNLVATDCYRVSIEPVEHDGDEDFAFTLPVAACKKLLSVFKTVEKFASCTLCFDAETHTLDVEADGTRSLLTCSEHEYVNWRQVQPAETAAAESIALNPSFLADLGKIKAAAGTPARFSFHGTNKPATIEFTGGPRVLLMNVRVDG